MFAVFSDEEALRQRRIRLLAGETAESQAPAVEAESETAEPLLRALEQGNRDVSEGRTKLAEAALNQLRARLNEPDAHERLDRVIAARGRAKVPPLAGRDFPSDLHLVLVAAETLAGDLERARAWLDVPLPEYDHLTPRQLVDCGRADTVLAHIAQLQSGSSG